MFSGAFRAPFVSPVASAGAAATPWYLAGGVLAANCKAAYQPIGAASLAASYVNLANPGTNDAAPGTAPSWASATGWTFNGTSQYLTTGVTPSSVAWSMIVRFSNAPNSDLADKYMLGGYNSQAQAFVIVPGGNSSFSNKRLYYNAFRKEVSSRVTSGVMAVAGQTAYLDGVAESGAITTGTVTTRSVYIGAMNLGSPYGYFPVDIQALAIYDTTLTGAQVAAITAAMNALTG